MTADTCRLPWRRPILTPPGRRRDVLMRRFAERVVVEEYLHVGRRARVGCAAQWSSDATDLEE